MNQTTPKKRASCTGRKPKKEATASDNCRLCGCCFKTQFGNFKTGWITMENIFTAPQRKGKTLPMLAEVFRADQSLDVEEKNSLSSRVCSPCGTKVRNCTTMLSQIKEKLNKPNPAFTMAADNDPMNGEQEVLRMKRMSKSPHYSQNKKYSRVSTQQAPLFPEQHQPLTEPTARRSLATDYEESEDKENSLSELPTAKHVPQRNKPAETSVVIEINYGNSTKRSEYEGSEIGNLLKYITRKEWKAVLNIIFKMKEFQNVLPWAVQSAINREFELYCKSPNLLKRISPEDLKNLSNTVLANEVTSRCPIWFASARGACGKVSKPCDFKISNAIALSTAIVARCRNNKLSAVAHQISAILIHSGAKSSDFTRLNRLGICMSHDQTIKKQVEMGKSYNAKILSWKQEVESRELSKKILSEVIEKQSDETVVDMSRATLQDYSNFSSKGFNRCVTLLEEQSAFSGQVSTEDVKKILATENSKDRKTYR